MCVAGGASSAQNALRNLAESIPNLLWCGRDRAHTARIAMNDALLAEEGFKRWWGYAVEPGVLEFRVSWGSAT